MKNLYAIYNQAAETATRARHLLNSSPRNPFFKLNAVIAANREKAARDAYLATCPNRNEYLNRPTANTQ